MGTANDTLSETKEIAEPVPELSFRMRFALCAAAWAIATVTTAGFSLEILFWAWLFPVGLFGLFTPPNWEPPGGPAILVLGWLFYLGWSFYLLAQRRRARFLLLMRTCWCFCSSTLSAAMFRCANPLK